MAHSTSTDHSAAHAVALSRLQARRGDDGGADGRNAAHAGFADTVVDATVFADTVPLWFRSEAFAEDVIDSGCASSVEPPGASAGWMRGRRRIDAHVLAAGAAVLRLSLQALQRQPRG
jgi:hypothetical protein